MYLLDENEISFPHPSLSNEDGVLAFGGDLSPQRLLFAYENGIFPWFNEGEPIVWWSPDPRFVLYPEDLKVSKSMRPYFNQGKFQVTFDTVFQDVIENCKLSSRSGQEGTWITDDMVSAYVKLNELGFAHSVEVWDNEVLVGGLYGISLGKCFFGESMFQKKSNASKFGFITLVRKLKSIGFNLIDAQTPTKHLESLGAINIPRKDFLEILEKNKKEKTLRGNWNELLNNVK